MNDDIRISEKLFDELLLLMYSLGCSRRIGGVISSIKHGTLDDATIISIIEKYSIEKSINSRVELFELSSLSTKNADEKKISYFKKDGDKLIPVIEACNVNKWNPDDSELISRWSELKKKQCLPIDFS
jgi:hypothetical protein